MASSTKIITNFQTTSNIYDISLSDMVLDVKKSLSIDNGTTLPCYRVTSRSIKSTKIPYSGSSPFFKNAFYGYDSIGHFYFSLPYNIIYKFILNFTNFYWKIASATENTGFADIKLLHTTSTSNVYHYIENTMTKFDMYNYTSSNNNAIIESIGIFDNIANTSVYPVLIERDSCSFFSTGIQQISFDLKLFA